MAPIAEFDTTRFHEKDFPEGKVFKKGQELPTHDDWKTTPAAFDPAYVEPALDTSDPEGDRMHRAIPTQAFPTHRYKKGDADHPLDVASAEDLAQLDPRVWKNTPDPAAWAGESEVVTDSASPPSTPPAPLGAGTETSPPRTHLKSLDEMSDSEKAVVTDQLAKDAQDGAELYAAKADDIKKTIAECPDAAHLDRIRILEASNPAGPRVPILKAVSTRLDALKAAK